MLSLINGTRLRLINAWLMLADFTLFGVHISKGSRFRCIATIGRGTRINGPCLVKGQGRLNIGKYCAIGDSLRIITSNHNTNSLAVQYNLQSRLIGQPRVSEKRDIRVGNDVWIGDNVIILPGVHVGNGAVIGAGSVVTKSIEPYMIVAGNPARVVGRRATKALAEALNQVEWWNWSEEKMQSCRKVFLLSLDAVTPQELTDVLDDLSSDQRG